MSNELIIVAVAVGLAVIAVRIAGLMVRADPSSAMFQRVEEVVREADPDLLARLSLQDLQRPVDPVHRADATGVGL